MIFYCICDGVNTAARVWFVFQVMGALFSPKWVKSRMRIGWVGMMVFAVQNQLDVIKYKLLFSNFVLLLIKPLEPKIKFLDNFYLSTLLLLDQKYVFLLVFHHHE